MGSDGHVRLGNGTGRVVSIHAPAWGATWARTLMMAVPLLFQSTLPHGERRAGRHRHPGRNNSFNPRSRMGSDRVTVAIILAGAMFQSTLPHGERLRASMMVWYTWSSFNPRSRMGSDSAWRVAVATDDSFNPRSRMGSDMHQVTAYSLAKVSIHAPAWGATRPA